MSLEMDPEQGVPGLSKKCNGCEKQLNGLTGTLLKNNGLNCRDKEINKEYYNVVPSEKISRDNEGNILSCDNFKVGTPLLKVVSISAGRAYVSIAHRVPLF